MLIESPNKINTISKYLKNINNKNIKIMATVGHIRELDERSYGGLGFDSKTYETKWKNDSKKKVKGKNVDIIEDINQEADKSEEIYLSTDPDREGEGISWHIYSVLNEKNRKKCKRVSFNEITQTSIQKALQNPRDLDYSQINSYLARKILDRGIGFKLSDFARKSIGGDSAGRVQSIALKFLKDKNDEIDAFIPDHWFNIRTFLENGLELTLRSLADYVKAEIKNVETSNLVNFANEDEANSFKESLDKEFVLVSIEEPKTEKQSPHRAFKTSTLQTTAINN